MSWIGTGTDFAFKKDADICVDADFEPNVEITVEKTSTGSSTGRGERGKQ
jgi:hypothetical protein